MLKNHHGKHGEESKEEEFGDLPLSDQVPLREGGETEFILPTCYFVKQSKAK